MNAHIEFFNEVVCVLSSRRDQYGPAKDQINKIAALWSIIVGKPLTPADVCRCMIALKLVRLTAPGKQHDSLVDIAGYTSLLSSVEEGKDV